MKISKREKSLLIFLLIALLYFGYYWFLVKPLEAKVGTLKVEAEGKRNEQQLILTKLATKDRVNSELENLRKEISEKGAPYYTALTQEEMIMTALELQKDNVIEFTKMNYIADADDDPMTNIMGVQIGLNGDYYAVMDYIKALENYPKKIIVKKITLQSSKDDQITGEIQLQFNSVKDIAPYVAEDKKLVSLQDNYRDYLMDPFKAFEGFAYVEDIPVVEYPSQVTEIDYKNYRPKIQIYGFEDGSNFFVGSSDEMSGQILRSQTKVAGGYSAEMTFDFIAAREVNEASLVFDTNPVMIQRQAEYLGLWTYAYEAGNHSIGVVLVDSMGKEFRIELTGKVDWTGWKELEVVLPVEINYPCKVQRIYVEGLGYDQKISGKYLFDQLQISYPIEQGGN